MNLNELKTELSAQNAQWDARTVHRDFFLGYTPGPPNRPLEEREAAATANLQEAMRAPTRAAVAAKIDWRHFPGRPPLPAGNYVTAVRDQSSCGSCVAFGTVATFEAALRIQAKNPKLAVDLSEADLFYCHGGVNPGPKCRTGWYPEAALAVCQKPGIVDEKCFPYTPGDQPCKRCADWQKRVHKIRSWKKITTHAEMKNALGDHGPLVTCMAVYEDFFHYHTGVYHHVSGGRVGGHCICCVGYDDQQQFWTCKNSWGTGWGDKGFFKIAYGQCAIDASMWMLQV
jgi:C1A family cysteine protease